MADKSKKTKEKSIWEHMWSRPSGPQEAQGKDNRPSIAERINFGGQYPGGDKPQKKKGKTHIYKHD